MNRISACVICYNEIEMLPHCLEYLNSLDNVDEICVLDSFSNDGTWEFISNFKTNKIYKIKQQIFTSFGKQKNDCIAMTEGNWILLIDADETYSRGLDKLLKDIKFGSIRRIKVAFRIMTLITWPDKQHYVNPEWLDPHIRIWRKDLCRYKGDCHEILYDTNNRELHGCYHKDIYTIEMNDPIYKVVMLHHQRLKSNDALIEKGERWSSLDMLTKSAEQKLPVTKTSWLEYKQELINGVKQIHPIPPEFWDYK